MSVLAPTAVNLWNVIKSYGIDPAGLFLEEGLEIQLPIAPDMRIEYEKIDRIRARAAQLSGDVNFGLTSGQHFHPSQLGALGYAWLASSSLLTALKRMQRFVRVLNDAALITVQQREEVVSVTVAINKPSVDVTARDNALIALLVEMCRINCGPDLNPLSVRFRHDAPEDEEAYSSLFRCPVHFNASENEIRIRLSDAERTLASANPMLVQLNEQVVMRRLAQLNSETIPNRVRGAILDQITSGNLTEESIAESLHMTSRTLHRRLKSEGASFREILKAVRQDLAEQYIEDPSLSLTEIAFLLGFSEMSSFSRAHKNWTGVSPSEARRSL